MMDVFNEILRRVTFIIEEFPVENIGCDTDPSWWSGQAIVLCILSHRLTPSLGVNQQHELYTLLIYPGLSRVIDSCQIVSYLAVLPPSLLGPRHHCHKMAHSNYPSTCMFIHLPGIYCQRATYPIWHEVQIDS